MTEGEKNKLTLGASKGSGFVQFNLDDVKDKVADQMRVFLLNMMPANAFSQVIEIAFKKLTEPRPEVDYRGGPDIDGRGAWPRRRQRSARSARRQQLA